MDSQEALKIARELCRMETMLTDGKAPWRVEYGPSCTAMGPGCPWCAEAAKVILAGGEHE